MISAALLAMGLGLWASLISGLLLNLGFLSAAQPDDAPLAPVFKAFAQSLGRLSGWPWLWRMASPPPPPFPHKAVRGYADIGGFVAGLCLAIVLSSHGVVFCLVLAALLATSIAAAIVDWQFLILPDEFHVVIAALALTLMAVGQWPVGVSFAAAGLLLVTGLLLAIVYSRLRGQEMLGFGDVKLMTASGLWLTPADVPLYMVIAGIGGIATNLLWRRLGKGKASPFGPALILALLGCVLYRVVLAGI